MDINHKEILIKIRGKVGILVDITNIWCERVF